MKKIALILTVALVLTSVFGLYVSADITKHFDTSVVCKYENGEKIVEIKLSTDFIAAGISGTVETVDGASISLKKGILGTATSSAYNSVADSFAVRQNGSIGFSMIGDLLNGGSSGEWYTMKLNNISGEGYVSLTDIVATNANGKKLSVAKTDISVNLEWLEGDATGDGEVNIIDLVRTKKITANNDNSSVQYFCNIDSDNNDTINAIDLKNLRTLLLK